MLRPMALASALALAACKPAPEPDYDDSFAGPYAEVVVEAGNGRIEISVGEGDGVESEFLPSGSDTRSSDEDGGTLTLIASCFGEEEAGCSGGFRIRVPAGQSVRAETDSGAIDFLAGLAGRLDAQTASGDISFTDVGAADATLLTGTGEVRARFADAPTAISFDTGSSLLSVQVPAGTYALELDTTGASSVDPGIEDGDGPPIRLHSGTGTIDLYVTE